jgi:ABC-type amino acid transport substrate-binding protein
MMMRALVVGVCGVFVVFTFHVLRQSEKTRGIALDGIEKGREKGRGVTRQVVGGVQGGGEARRVVGEVRIESGDRSLVADSADVGIRAEAESLGDGTKVGALDEVGGGVKRTSLRIGWNNNPPRKYWSDGARGFLVPVLKRLAEVMDYDVSFEFCVLRDCLEKVRLGELDAVVETMKNPEREVLLEYLKPQISVDIVKVAYQRLGDARRVSGLADLYQMKVGVLRGQTNFLEFDQAKGFRRVEFGDVEGMIAAVEAGVIDVFLGSEDFTDYVRSRRPGKLQKTGLVHREAILVNVLAVGRQSPVLQDRDRLSQALESLVRRGEFARLIQTQRSQM